MSKKRAGHPPHLSSTRASRGSAYPGGVSGVLFERDLAASPASLRSWAHATSSVGETRQHSDAGRFFPDHRRALFDDAALHRAGRRRRAATAPTQTHAAEPASSAHRRAPQRVLASNENVVQTLRFRSLKTKGVCHDNPSNCESKVNLCDWSG